MPERPHPRTPSTAALVRRLLRLVEREISQLERHYDALEPAPPAEPHRPGALPLPEALHPADGTIAPVKHSHTEAMKRPTRPVGTRPMAAAIFPPAPRPRSA
jgi:hypothetical protein